MRSQADGLRIPIPAMIHIFQNQLLYRVHTVIMLGVLFLPSAVIIKQLLLVRSHPEVRVTVPTQASLFNSSIFSDANIGEDPSPGHPWPISQTLISFPPHRGPPPITINFPSPTPVLAERAVCAADRMPCAVPDRCCPVGGYCTTDAIGQPGCCPTNAICGGVTNTGQGVFVPVETDDSDPYIPTGASSRLRPPTVFGMLSSLFQVMSSELNSRNSGPHKHMCLNLKYEKISA
jgi:hypothetical protein